MYRDKKVLLIAGGGTRGTHTARELLRLGAAVDVICPEEKVSNDPKLTFHRALVSHELLDELFSKYHYDGVVDFIHYKDPEQYKVMYDHLRAHIDHVIFLSSYRVYANSDEKITENSPRLLDVESDKDFLARETYALPKSVCEDWLRRERAGEHWTIVRPVISFSHLRLDLLLYSGTKVLKAAEEHRPLLLPKTVKDYGAGIDWAGNSGKLIANLLFKPHTYGETYTVYSNHGATWGEVAAAYEEVTGVQIVWCEEAEYVASLQLDQHPHLYDMWYHDRIYNRRIDGSKILAATGLARSDFAALADGIRYELDVLNRKRS
jgi:nucleoside-diphosphate-sugar epimerase